MKKILLIFIIFFSLLIIGCVTPKYHESESSIVQSDDINDIEVKCRFLSHNDIINIHGFKHNPFVDPPIVLTPKPVLVFELTIQNREEAPIKLDIRDIEFFYNDKSYKPLSKVQIEDKINEFGDNGMDKAKQKRIASAYMLGDIKKIEGNSTVKGYLVFMGGFKDKGSSELYLPFKTVDSYEAGNFTFYYDFRRK